MIGLQREHDMIKIDNLIWSKIYHDVINFWSHMMPLFVDGGSFEAEIFRLITDHFKWYEQVKDAYINWK